MKGERVSRWILLFSSIALLFLPYVFPICPVMGKPMRCFFTYRTEFLFAILAIVQSLLLFWAQKKETKKAVSILLLFTAIILWFLPYSFVLGICAHGDSPCHVTTLWVRLVSALLALSSIASIWFNRGGKSERR